MNRHPLFASGLPAAILLTSTSSPAVAGAPGAKAWAAASLAAAAKAGTIEPTSSAFVNASAVMPFIDSATYHVYAAPEHVTDIMLQPGEVLGAVASGDTARWVIGDTTSGAGADKRAHILVKPTARGLSTNLVVTTNRRTYHLLLSSESVAAMVALSWTYSQDALIALRKTQQVEAAVAPIAAGLDVQQLRFNYAVSGDAPDWRPLRAFDDGRQTYIEFPATVAVGEAPPLFLVDARGTAELVNYRMRGRYYVVDRIFDAAELRLGTKHQQIVRIIRVGEPGLPAHGLRRAS